MKEQNMREPIGNMRIDNFEKQMKENEDQTWRTLFLGT
jgi:hypothetical protein